MIDRNMMRSTAVTKRSAHRWHQPVMRPARPAESHQVTLSDAEVVVRWLNGSQRRTLLAIREKLMELSKGLADLQRTHDSSPVFLALKSGVAPSPDANWTAKYRREYQRIQKQMITLNKTLSRYVFRPGIGYTVISNMRGAGLLPDAGRQKFRLIVGEWKLVEADAVLSLIRLYLVGELDRVQLCKMCKKRWLVQAKSHYRFCSSECRQAYYSKAAGYAERRKKIQQDYRDRMKRNRGYGWREKE